MTTATILAARDATAHRARIRTILTLAAAELLVPESLDEGLERAVADALEAINVKAPKPYATLDDYAAALVSLDYRARALDEDRLEEFLDADEVAVRAAHRAGGRAAYREELVDDADEAVDRLIGASFPGPTPITG